MAIGKQKNAFASQLKCFNETRSFQSPNSRAFLCLKNPNSRACPTEEATLHSPFQNVAPVSLTRQQNSLNPNKTKHLPRNKTAQSKENFAPKPTDLRHMRIELSASKITPLSLSLSEKDHSSEATKSPHCIPHSWTEPHATSLTPP